jgi:hypothetical protein
LSNSASSSSSKKAPSSEENTAPSEENIINNSLSNSASSSSSNKAPSSEENVIDTTPSSSPRVEAANILMEIQKSTANIDYPSLETIEYQLQLSFLDNTSMPYYLVDAFFKFGTPNIEKFNSELEWSGQRLKDFTEEMYGKDFTDPFRSVPPDSVVFLNMMDFLSLKQPQWIEANIIEIYFVLLNSKEIRLAEIYSERRKQLFLPSTFLQLLQFETINLDNDFAEMKIDCTKLQTLFLPINTNNNHWMLVEILLDKFEIVVYNSLKTHALKDEKQMAML